jgi:hypothetical protein
VEVRRADLGARGGSSALVVESHPCTDEIDTVHQEAHGRLIRASVGFRRQRRGNTGKIEASVFLDHEIEFGLVEADLGEGPRPVEEARGFGVRHDALHRAKRHTVHLGDPQIKKFETQREGVEAYAVDAGLHPQRILQGTGQKVFQRGWQQQEARERIARKHARSNTQQPLAIPRHIRRQQAAPTWEQGRDRHADPPEANASGPR